MKKILALILIFNFQFSIFNSVSAQPQARKQQQAQAQKKSAMSLTTRAQISYPTEQKMAEDVVWRRDIYREVDLTKGDNAGMYYPIEPVGNQMNLFTYLFKLVLSGQVKAYEYRLDGNESFEADAQVKPLSILDNYHIFYEKKDGRLKLDNSDIPSREVKTYYIKESAYFDQNSATFHRKVIALCPIMSREDDFGDGATKYPLFWVKYDDVAPFLTKQTIMTSNLNNAATMSMADFFVKGLYSGKIYKTNNLLGETLAQYCNNNDTVMQREQKHIEDELIAFEKNIWGDQVRKDSLDSIAKKEATMSKSEKKALAKQNRRAGGAAVTSSSKKRAGNKSGNTSSKSSNGSARVSVRRERH